MMKVELGEKSKVQLHYNDFTAEARTRNEIREKRGGYNKYIHVSRDKEAHRERGNRKVVLNRGGQKFEYVMRCK